MEILLRLQVIFLVFWGIFSLIIIVKAWEESGWNALLCLVLPLYIYYYAFFRLQSDRKGLIVGAFLLTTFPGPVLALVGPLLLSGKACTLTTQAEMEEALGEPVEQRVATLTTTPFGSIDSCRCKTVKEPSKIVVVALAQKCDSLQRVRQEAAGRLTEIPGVGDEAVWGGNELVARKGTSCIYLNVQDQNVFGGMGRQNRFQVARTVARNALARLP